MRSMSYDSPMGKITMIADKGAVTALNFAGNLELVNEGGAEEPVLLEAARWLDGYFKGTPGELPPIAPAGTEFQKRVWGALRVIPFGETRSYGQIAREIGCASARAVGGAIGKNPLLIMIPCHRVMGADGSLTGFSAGIEYKTALLEHEMRFT